MKKNNLYFDSKDELYKKIKSLKKCHFCDGHKTKECKKIKCSICKNTKYKNWKKYRLKQYKEN